jgi:uncharacterized protein (DUF1330 family)
MSLVWITGGVTVSRVRDLTHSRRPRLGSRSRRSDDGRHCDEGRDATWSGERMPAYLIANIQVTNPDGYRGYAEQVGETIEAHGGRYLARGGTVEVLEGEWEPQRLVVLEFPTLESAHAWYESAEYQRLRELRVDSSHGQLVLTEGLDA